MSYEFVDVFGNYQTTYMLTGNYLYITTVDTTTGLYVGSASGPANDATMTAGKVKGMMFEQETELFNQLQSAYRNIEEQQAFLNSGSPELDADLIRFSNEIIADQQRIVDTIKPQLAALKDASTSVFFDAQGISNMLQSKRQQDLAAASPAATTASTTATTIPTVNSPTIPVTTGSIDVSAQTPVAANTGSNSTTTLPVTTSSTTPPANGVAVTPPPARAVWKEAMDLRVKLRVPPEYIREGTPSAGPTNIIQKNGGILFPYTPSISYDNKAEYAQQSPLHSNFAQYFYKNSSVGPISVSGKFTVQNEFEGAVLLGILHLLRSLTKMRFGTDPHAGSPPPVCRFDAYGDYMMYNVPVSVASWKHEMPDNVDYIAVGRPGSPLTYGHSMVPVVSTISLELNVMYSRREMLEHNIPQWINGDLKYRGYL